MHDEIAESPQPVPTASPSASTRISHRQRHLKRHFKLHGQSIEELERRIQTLRLALQLRRGAILRIKRHPPAPGRKGRATIYYELPVASLRRAAAD